MSAHVCRVVWLAALTLSAGAVRAQGALPDAGAVDPLDYQVAPPAEPAPPPWGIKVVNTLEQRRSRQSAQWPDGSVYQLALDVRHEWRLGPGWRLNLSDRLERDALEGGQRDSRNVLREAFLSADAAEGWYVDAGRINLRQGVAQGWNPTDWLREGTVGPAWQSPGAARDNRYGAVMLRTQHSRAAGSAELAWLPRLRDERSATPSDWGLNLDRGNDAQALALRVTPQLGAWLGESLGQRLSLDVNALARQGQHPGWGSNLTAVLTPRWLALVEAQWQSRVALAAPQAAAPAPGLALRLAAGLSLTLDSGALLGVEWHHADDALSCHDWRAWRASAATPAGARALGTLRVQRAQRLDPLLRDTLFLRGQWTDVTGDGSVDASTFARVSPCDGSRWLQLDGAWHFQPHRSLLLALAATRGDADSEHGARALERILTVGLQWLL